jgi:DNA invertase Pin-like site-specific DNA recombinase
LPDVLKVTDVLDNYGVSVYFAAQGLDSRQPGFRQIFTLHGMMDEQYVFGLRDKVHRGQEGRVRKGYVPGGKCYGYRNVPVEDPSVTVSGNKEELAEQQVQIAPSLLSPGRSNQRGSVKDVPEHFVKDVMRLDIPPYWRGLVFCFPPALAGTVTDVLATLCKGCHVTEHLKAQP